MSGWALTGVTALLTVDETTAVFAQLSTSDVRSNLEELASRIPIGEFTKGSEQTAQASVVPKIYSAWPDLHRTAHESEGTRFLKMYNALGLAPPEPSMLKAQNGCPSFHCSASSWST